MSRSSRNLSFKDSENLLSKGQKHMEEGIPYLASNRVVTCVSL